MICREEILYQHLFFTKKTLNIPNFYFFNYKDLQRSKVYNNKKINLSKLS